MSSLRLLKHPNSSSMFAQRRDVFEGAWCLLREQASVSICSFLFSCFSSEFILSPLAVTKHNPTPTYPCKHSVIVEGGSVVVGWRECGSLSVHRSVLTYNRLSNTNSTHLRWPMSYSNVNIVVFFGGFRHTGEFSRLSGWSLNSYTVTSKMAQELKALDTKPGRAVQSPGTDVASSAWCDNFCLQCLSSG